MTAIGIDCLNQPLSPEPPKSGRRLIGLATTLGGLVLELTHELFTIAHDFALPYRSAWTGVHGNAGAPALIFIAVATLDWCFPSVALPPKGCLRRVSCHSSLMQVSLEMRLITFRFRETLKKQINTC